MLPPSGLERIIDSIQTEQGITYAAQQRGGGGAGRLPAR